MEKLCPLGNISSLLQCYASGELSPTRMVETIHAEIQNDPDHVWICTLPLEFLKYYASKVEAKGMAGLPLYGIPFAIKDNIDLASVPTTAACPAFAYTPAHSATVVRKLMDAGAIPIGKTNLDQFATGLNGTRSPYGACRNAFNPDYISGGSSSGSAVAVAKGQVCFSLGTDTAGSGRVPATFNNLIGYKPTRGWFSTHGVVPACRSLDTVSIFALTAADAARILAVSAGDDAADIYSRQREEYNFDFGTTAHLASRWQHPAHYDKPLLRLAHRLQQVYSLPLGATAIAFPKNGSFPDLSHPSQVRIAVCGAHLSGLPLNGQLTSRQGRLVACTTTSADYRLYALPGNPPQRPGLI